MATTQIKLIHSKERKEFRVTVNGVDQYIPFKYETQLEFDDVKTKAKAAAFDEACKETMVGKILVSFDVF